MSIYNTQIKEMNASPEKAHLDRARKSIMSGLNKGIKQSMSTSPGKVRGQKPIMKKTLGPTTSSKSTSKTRPLKAPVSAQKPKQIQ